MKLKDLKTGMRIILRNGDELIVLKEVVTPCIDEGVVDMYISTKTGWLLSTSYNDDLTMKNRENKEFDIMQVYAENYGEYVSARVLKDDAIENMDKIWDRKEEKRKMTVSQICEKLGYDIEIVKED